MFFVLAAATFSLCIRETPDLSCCKKLFPLDKLFFFFFLEAAKACGVSKSIFQMLSSYGPSARVFEGII